MSRRLDWLLPSWLENANAFDQSMDEDMSSIGYTILFNVIIWAVCVGFFSFYRRYDPKLYTPKVDMFPDKTLPRIPHDTYFGWIVDLYNITDDQIIEKAGYDQLFLIRFYRLAFKIFSTFAIYAWGVVLPVNRLGGANVSGINSFEIWSMTNISQGSRLCWFHFFGICILTWVTIFFVEKEYVIYAKYRHIYLRRKDARLRTVIVEGIPHKMRSNVTLATYFEALYPNAIVCVRLAQDLRQLEQLVADRENALAKLERYDLLTKQGHSRPMIKVGNMIQPVDAIKYYCMQVNNLNEAIEREQESSRRLAIREDRKSGSNAINVIGEFLHVTQIGALKRMMKNKSGSSKKWFVKSQEDDDNIGRSANDKPKPYNSFSVYRLSWSEWVWKLWTAPTAKELWRGLKDGRHGEYHGTNDERANLISPPEERNMFLSKAFVTFKTFTAATTARQVIHMQLIGRMAISEAPEPTDILWQNLYTSRTSVFYRRLIIESAVILLNVIWVAPVTLVSFVVSEDALRNYFPFIDILCSRSQWFESAIDLIQPGVLVALMMILPPILQALGMLEGYISHSSIQFRTFDRYFFFQIINVFLVTTIAGSVIDCLKEVYNSPTSTFELLGSSLPKMGAFFTNFMFIKAFTGLGMEIIRLAAMFSGLLKLLTPNLTLRERKATPLFGGIRATFNPGWFAFAKVYAQDMLQVVLCANYANIAPLILVAGLCYFGMASFIYKHQLLYVYEPIYETGGKWWPKIARCFIVALLLSQATMLGMFILKEVTYQSYCLGLVLILTAVYYWNVANVYVPLANHLPFDMATSMDLDEEESQEEVLINGAEVFMQPPLRAQTVSIDFINEEKHYHANI